MTSQAFWLFIPCKHMQHLLLFSLEEGFLWGSMWREYELLCLASMRHHSGLPGQIRLLMAEMRLNFSKTSGKLKLISATQTSGKFGGKWVFVQNVLNKYAVIEQIFYTYRRNTQEFKKIYTTAKKLKIEKYLCLCSEFFFYVIVILMKCWLGQESWSGSKSA